MHKMKAFNDGTTTSHVSLQKILRVSDKKKKKQDEQLAIGKNPSHTFIRASSVGPLKPRGHNDSTELNNSHTHGAPPPSSIASLHGACNR